MATKRVLATQNSDLKLAKFALKQAKVGRDVYFLYLVR